jgi:hypothetical protein
LKIAAICTRFWRISDCISQDEKKKDMVSLMKVSFQLDRPQGIPNLAEELQIARNLFY